MGSVASPFPGAPQAPQDIVRDKHQIETMSTATALNGAVLPFAGDFLALVSAPGGITVTISIDRQESDITKRVPLGIGDKIYTQFHRIYVYTSAAVA